MTYRDLSISIGRGINSSLEIALGIFLAGVMLLGFIALDGVLHTFADRKAAPIVETPRPAGPRIYDVQGNGQGHAKEVNYLVGPYGELIPEPLDPEVDPDTDAVDPYDEPFPIVPPPRPRHVAPPRPPFHPPKAHVEKARPVIGVPSPSPAPTVHPADQPPAHPVAPAPVSPPAGVTQTSWHAAAINILQSGWQAIRVLLPPTWQTTVIALVLLAGAFMRWGIEFLAISAFTIREWVAAIVAWARDRFENGRRMREQKSWKDLGDKEYRREIERRTKRIEKMVRRSDMLYAEGDRLEASAWGPDFVVRRLRRRAAAYLDAAEREQAELDRAEALRAEVKQAQRAAKDAEAAEHVRALLGRLSSKIEYSASHAFAELRKIDASFDWNAILPDGLPGEARERIVKLLRLVVGTGNLAEAKAACGRALHILNSHNASWAGRAA